jgi:hypothetical protein
MYDVEGKTGTPGSSMEPPGTGLVKMFLGPLYLS